MIASDGQFMIITYIENNIVILQEFTVHVE